MEKLEIKVTKTSISVTNAYVLNQGEYQVDKCNFNFSEEYEGLIKKAIFIDSENNLEFEMVILNDECDIPYEILQTSKEFTMKVYGYKVENDELIVRYSPTALKVFLREGSYQGSKEVITPSQFEQYEQALHDGLVAIDNKIEEIDTEVDEKIEEIDNTLSSKVQEVNDKIDEVDDKIIEVNNAIVQTNNLNIDVSDKVNKKVDITLTKKDNTTKAVSINDGESLQFIWQGTSLGIKTDSDVDYTFVNLQGIQGKPGPQGEPFSIKKTYSSVAQMQADFNNMNLGDYVMIASSVEIEDNAKLYVRGEEEWLFISDFSGAQGIQGPIGLTPNIQIGSVTSGTSPSVTRTGTDENPILNFVLEKGKTGETGPQGETGNGITSITKTSTSGLVDTYTITYDNGTTSTFEVTNGEDGEVTQAQLDDTNREVDKYKTIYNVLPKVENDTLSSEVELSGTGEAYMKVKPIGKVSQKTLPSEYTAVDYVESHGTEYIDSGYLPNNKTKIITRSHITSTVGFLFGCGLQGQYVNIGLLVLKKDDDNYCYAGRTRDSASSNITIMSDIPIGNTFHTFELSGEDGFKIDNTLIGSLSSYNYSDNKNLYLFAWNSGETPGVFANGVIANFKIYDNNTLVRDFIPCYRNSDNEVGMYDLINDVFYTNQGTGSFTYGSAVTMPNPDYPQPIKVVTGDNNVKVQNKNLFNYNSYTYDKTILNSYRFIQITNIKPNTKYTIFNYGNLNGFDNVYFAGNSSYNNIWFGTLLVGTTSKTFTTHDNGKLYLCAYANTWNETVWNTFINNFKNAMLVEGETEVPYEPHKEQNYQLNIGNLEMYEGDYFFKNEIDSEDYDSNLDLNAWYLKNNWGKVVFNGSESWVFAMDRTNTALFSLIIDDIKNIGNVQGIDFYINNFIKGDAYNKDKEFSEHINTALFISILKTRLDSVTNTGFKNWLSNNNTIVVYPLANPTYKKVTDTTLISQLEASDSANSYKEKTYITCTSASVDNEVLQVKAVALADLSDILNQTTTTSSSEL